MGTPLRLASRALDTPRSRLSPGLHGSCAIGAPVSLNRLSMLRYENSYPIDSLEHRLAAVVVDNKRERSDSGQEEGKQLGVTE